MGIKHLSTIDTHFATGFHSIHLPWGSVLMILCIFDADILTGTVTPSLSTVYSRMSPLSFWANNCWLSGWLCSPTSSLSQKTLDRKYPIIDIGITLSNHEYNLTQYKGFVNHWLITDRSSQCILDHIVSHFSAICIHELGDFSDMSYMIISSVKHILL